MPGYDLQPFAALQKQAQDEMTVQNLKLASKFSDLPTNSKLHDHDSATNEQLYNNTSVRP